MDNNQIEEGMTLPELEDIVFDAFAKLDPTSPEFGDSVEALAKLYGAGISKKQIQVEAEVATEKIRTEAEVNYDKNTVDEAHHSEEARANREHEGLERAKIAVMLVGSVLTALSNLWLVKRATAKEDESAILKLTDRTVVTENLRKGLFRMPLFGQKEL